MRQLFFSLFIYNYIELIASYRLLLGDFTTSCSQKDQDPSNLQSNKRNSIHTDNFFEQFKLLHEQCQTFCFSFCKQAVKIEIEHSGVKNKSTKLTKSSPNSEMLLQQCSNVLWPSRPFKIHHLIPFEQQNTLKSTFWS
jgi:hypothetical protein